jgi:hypothetical protein
MEVKFLLKHMKDNKKNYLILIVISFDNDSKLDESLKSNDLKMLSLHKYLYFNILFKFELLYQQ